MTGAETTSSSTVRNRGSGRARSLATKRSSARRRTPAGDENAAATAPCGILITRTGPSATARGPTVARVNTLDWPKTAPSPRVSSQGPSSPLGLVHSSTWPERTTKRLSPTVSNASRIS
jgi:hypothetical protein